MDEKGACGVRVCCMRESLLMAHAYLEGMHESVDSVLDLCFF